MIRPLVIAVLAACSAWALTAVDGRAVVSGQGDDIVSIPVPVGTEAGMYSLASSGANGALLSWLEPSPKGLAFKFSSLVRGQWSAPTTIVEGPHLFSNWADHPSIAAQPNGALIAQWPLVNDGPRPKGSYNNSMRIARSTDRGLTWTQIFADGLDNIHSYSGFVSLLPARGGARAVYLSPPHPISPDPMDHRMTLSHVAFSATGSRIVNGVVDSDTCSCCPTAVGMTAAGPIAAYRDHEAGEIRDIAIVRFVNGAWTSPAPVHRDGWVINGCPTNGPAIGTHGARVVVTWFTAASETPRLQIAFSADNGATFARPVQIDGAQAVGRPAALMLSDGSAVVAWLASTGDDSGKGELRVRRVSADGEMGPVIVAGAASPGRLSGMPQIVPLDRSLLVAWRGDRLQTVRMPVPLAAPQRSARRPSASAVAAR
jgi:hypothetical protein